MYVIKTYIYSRTPEIGTANLSQSHIGLNLSQFHTDCLLSKYSSTAILNYFKSFESTTLTSDKYWYFTLLMTFINWHVMYSLFFINDKYISWQIKTIFN